MTEKSSRWRWATKEDRSEERGNEAGETQGAPDGGVPGMTREGCAQARGSRSLPRARPVGKESAPPIRSAHGDRPQKKSKKMVSRARPLRKTLKFNEQCHVRVGRRSLHEGVTPHWSQDVFRASDWNSMKEGGQTQPQSDIQCCLVTTKDTEARWGLRKRQQPAHPTAYHRILW